jgi:hypothetical protein
MNCVTPNTCNANACGKKSDGVACTQAAECVHGNCNQGFCCATACTGTCQSCALAGSLGTCKFVPAGTDPLNQCTDAGAASCANDGTCDGSGACRNYGAGTVCVGAMCAGSTFTPARTCNGTGTCNTTAPNTCGSYVCSTSGCLTSCTTTADCTTPLTCYSGTCYGALINAGGPAVPPYAADEDFTGGALNAPVTAPIDLTGLVNPAPQAVYQTGRAGLTYSYTIPGFTAGSSHTVRMHFCETYWPPAGGPGAGNRICNVTLNGNAVLTNFDIFATATAKDKAVIESFTANANAAGAYVIQFTTVKDQCLVNGFDIQ